MKYRFIPLVLIITIQLSCTTGLSDSFDYEKYNYTTDSLELGIAFPNSTNLEALNSSIAYMQTLGINWTRIGEHWNYREATKDTYTWTPLETRLTQYNNANIKVLLTIETHEWPSWLGLDDATSTRDETETLAEFREYIADLLALYADKIERIQVGNEYDWEIDTYFNGKEEAYIAYCNILYEEVQKLPLADRPDVVLGSIAGAGSAALALDQNLISSIHIGEIEVYQTTIADYLNLPTENRMTYRIENVLANANFDYLDFHLYDDYEQWPLYLTAYKQALTNTGKADMDIIVSEFGGPYPESLYSIFGGEPAESLLAEKLVSYVHTLDDMDILEAYFFKLNQTNSGQAHPDSYLVTSNDRKTFSFEVLRRFGEN